MDIKGFPALIVGVVVALVLAGAVLPVFAETTSATDTFTNEAYYTLDKITEDSNITIRWELATPSVIEINGETMDLSNLEMSRSYTLVGSESVMVRYTKVYSGTFIETLGDPYINSNTGSPLTYCEIIINGFTMTVTDDRSTPTSESYTLSGDSYCITTDGAGEYAEVMKKSGVSAYVKGDSEIRLIGSTVGSVIVGVYGSGTIDDGIQMDTVYTSSNVITDVTYTDPEPTYTEVNNYKDLYQLEKFEFTMNYNTDQSMDATYTYFLVPAEVTAEKAVHPDGALTVMLNVLPLLAIAGLVTGAVVWFISRKG